MKRKQTREYSLQHTQERAKERYELELTEKEYDRLCNICRAVIRGNCLNGKEVEKEKNGDDWQYIVPVPWKGQVLQVVFSEKRDRVTTLLPQK